MSRGRRRPPPWTPKLAAQRILRAWFGVEALEQPPDGYEQHAERVVAHVQATVGEVALMAEQRAANLRASRDLADAAAATALDEFAEAVRVKYRLRP